MMQTASAQSILISGESGAGKTETTKLCMGCLAEISSSSGKSTEAALESGVLLEAFGELRQPPPRLLAEGLRVAYYHAHARQSARTDVHLRVHSHSHLCSQATPRRCTTTTRHALASGVQCISQTWGMWARARCNPTCWKSRASLGALSVDRSIPVVWPRGRRAVWLRGVQVLW